ncbi:MAG: peptidyl-prolyl cis-trans isomerase [Acidobacteriia bacterium]|nr:peptidyl-prolyl cis-trans isomerase [Terriglobia bacterium]
MSHPSSYYVKWAAGTVLLVFVLTCGLSFAQTPQPAAPAPAAKPGATPPVLQSATRAEPALFPKDTVVLTVGDHKLTAEQFNQILDLLPPQAKAFYSGAGKRQFVDVYAQLMIFSDEAKKEKLLDDPANQQRLNLFTDQTLAQIFVQHVNEKTRISDDEIKNYYDAHVKDYQEVKASHILIRAKGSPAPLPAGKKDLTPEEAKAKADEIYTQVTQPGADFAAVAKAESYDQGSAAKGGELGTFRHGQMVKEFEEAAFSMNPGDISHPIKTQFGFHIIKVDEKKTRTLEEVKPEIESKLKQDKVKEQLDGLKNSIKVDVNAQFFGPPPAPPAPPATATPTPPATATPPPKKP